MKPIALFLFSVAAITHVPIAARGQWGPGGCNAAFGPVGPPHVFVMSPRPQIDARMVYPGVADGWHAGHDAGGGSCSYFYRAGKREAVYLPEQKAYRTLNASGQWSAPTSAVPAGVKPFVESCPCCGDECPCKAGKLCKKNACQCIVGAAIVSAVATPAEKCESPSCSCGNETCKCPPGTTKCGDECHPTGVNMAEVRKLGSRCMMNGVDVSRETVMRQLSAPNPLREGDGKLIDDSAKHRWTAIGPKEDRERVINEMPADLKERYLIQGIDPDNYLVKESGFVTTGKPTVYVQKPDGTVLFRADAYEGPQMWAAIRKADPTYNPNKDPNGSTPASLPAVDSIPGWAWISAVIALLYWLFKPQAKLEGTPTS